MTFGWTRWFHGDREPVGVFNWGRGELSLNGIAGCLSEVFLWEGGILGESGSSVNQSLGLVCGRFIMDADESFLGG